LLDTEANEGSEVRDVRFSPPESC